MKVMDRYDIPAASQERLQSQLEARLKVLDEYAVEAMNIRATTPLGKIGNAVRRLFVKASEGPAYYRAPFTPRWVRPQNVAGSGCIILAFLIFISILLIGVYSVEYPAFGIPFISVLILTLAYNSIVRIQMKKKMTSLHERTIHAMNEREHEKVRETLLALKNNDSSNDTVSLLHSGAKARVFVSFTAAIIDFRKEYHYVAGDSAWIFDGSEFRNIYTFFKPASARPSSENIAEYTSAISAQYPVDEITDAVIKISPLPYFSDHYDFSWTLTRIS